MSENDLKKEIELLRENVLNISHELKAADIFTQSMMFVLLRLVSRTDETAIPFAVKNLEIAKNDILRQESGGEPFVRDALDRIDDLMRAIKSR